MPNRNQAAANEIGEAPNGKPVSTKKLYEALWVKEQNDLERFNALNKGIGLLTERMNTHDELHNLQAEEENSAKNTRRIGILGAIGAVISGIFAAVRLAH